MVAKIAVFILASVAAAQAGGLYGSTALGYAGGLASYGYGSHGYGAGYYGVSPYTSYAAPIVKTIAPVYTAPVAYTPAVSTVSQYSIHQAPVVKTIAPVSYSSYASPYLSHAYSPVSYGGYGGYGGYGYGGYGSKYAW